MPPDSGFRGIRRDIHTSLLDAARTGMILRLCSYDAFLHGPIQERLIRSSLASGGGAPSIGPMCCFASMAKADVAEHLFSMFLQINSIIGAPQALLS